MSGLERGAPGVLCPVAAAQHDPQGIAVFGELPEGEGAAVLDECSRRGGVVVSLEGAPGPTEQRELDPERVLRKS